MSQTGETGSIGESLPHSKSAHQWPWSNKGTVTGTDKSDCTCKASKVSPIFLSDYVVIKSVLWAGTAKRLFPSKSSKVSTFFF